MRIFKKAKHPVRQDEFARYIAGYILKGQSILANYLNEKVKDISYKSLIIFSTLFCVLYAAYCFYLLIAAIIN